MALRCNLCETTLAPHCDSPGCTWLTCSAPDCAAAVYDVPRGVLRMRDGTMATTLE